MQKDYKLRLQFPKIFIFLISIFITPSFAYHSVKFYISNNTSKTSLAKAKHIVLGVEQEHLKKVVVDIFKEQGINISQAQNAIGAYTSINNVYRTYENTLIITTTKTQDISYAKIVMLGKILALRLHQENTAVFIPINTEKTTCYILDLHASPKKINEFMKYKMPKYLSKSYSIHINKKLDVLKVEWLGENMDENKIKKIFPSDYIYPKKSS